MDEIIKSLSARLAERSSRRGFVNTLGKVALGAAAAIKGVGLGVNAEAAWQNMRCCTGTPCSVTNNVGPCPNNGSVQYAWVCSGPRGLHTWDCLDCFDSSNNYTCTYYAFRNS